MVTQLSQFCLHCLELGLYFLLFLLHSSFDVLLYVIDETLPLRVSLSMLEHFDLSQDDVLNIPEDFLPLKDVLVFTDHLALHPHPFTLGDHHDL